MSEEKLENMRKVIKLAFIRIGIRCDFAGFNYLCYAVELAVLSPELSRHLCRGLYVQIAKKFGIEKSGCIEKCIRDAIDYTQNTKSFAELNRMFKAMLYTVDDKPTAGELINLVAQYYLLDLYKE